MPHQRRLVVLVLPYEFFHRFPVKSLLQFCYILSSCFHLYFTAIPHETRASHHHYLIPANLDINLEFDFCFWKRYFWMALLMTLS